MRDFISKLFKSTVLVKLLGRLLLIVLVLTNTIVIAQTDRTLRGRIVDTKNNPLFGVSVGIKGLAAGTISDDNGEFSLNVPATSSQILLISFVGMIPQEIDIRQRNYVDVVLEERVTLLSEVIVVGYGTQQRESVIGAISQTTGQTLQRTGGVPSVGAALTGNIPGLVTLQGTGKPGEEDPWIRIRGQSTWNHAEPLVLVDGIERSLRDIDIRSVESISVLKDASATAVFGVKGANGVILVTTKRGAEGRAQIDVTSNVTVKVPSLIPNIYDAYDASLVRNRAIERELGIEPAIWSSFLPLAEIDKYRNPANEMEARMYPNVDWQRASFERYALSNNHNISLAGGTPGVKYFTSLDFLSEGDIMKVWDNQKGYTPGYGYDRMNVRSNLDFNLTKTTTLRTNLFGSHSLKRETWSGFEYRMWQAAYGNPPDAMHVTYDIDGKPHWGYYPSAPIDVMNSLQQFSNSGIRNTKTTRINTDFVLGQDLSMLIEGLNFRGTFAFDNNFVSQGGLFDDAGTYEAYVTREGEERINNEFGRNRYDYVLGEWYQRPDQMLNHFTRRFMYYQAQLNWDRQFAKHNVTAMGLFSRDIRAEGNQFPHYREDWVFRTTYNFALRYFFEFNGAYNGSEQFGRDYRFDFFPSFALGWTPSNEAFMNNINWLDMLRLRASYGLVGNDNIGGVGRWRHLTQWAYEDQSRLGSTFSSTSPYTWFRETVIGNPHLRWETVEKKNAGFEFVLLDNLIRGNVDFFEDYRYDILIRGEDRAVLSYVGGIPPTANLGEVKSRGYEIELNLNHRMSPNSRVWIGGSLTHAKDRIIFADNPPLLPAYQRAEGFPIGQGRHLLLGDFVNTWDEVFGTAMWESFDQNKLPGDYNVIDFNSDGVIDRFDNAPYGYPDRPQNTYNINTGLEFRGFSLAVQFYGVSNASRYLSLNSFPRQWNLLYDHGELWSKENPDADAFMPRYYAKTDGYYGHFHLYDGWYWRLKNVEVAYTFDGGLMNRIGVKALRVYVNGNNLLLWTRMPDDRESNLGVWGGNYPTVRRINFGLNLTL
jgi:TonB-linked SusC/RagA family outer membrane protein